MTPRPNRAPGTCGAPGCDVETYNARCPEHTRERRRSSDPEAGVRAARYGRRWRSGPRVVVLARDPLCTHCGLAASEVADHWPVERVDLLAAGIPDPDDPAYLVGACRPCANSRAAGRSARPRWSG